MSNPLQCFAPSVSSGSGPPNQFGATPTRRRPMIDMAGTLPLDLRPRVLSGTVPRAADIVIRSSQQIQVA